MVLQLDPETRTTSGRGQWLPAGKLLGVAFEYAREKTFSPLGALGRV